MKLIFSGHAWEDYLYWQETDRNMLNRINRLIHEIMRDPFTGSGKPEPLKHGLSGYWFRRINDEHSIVYRPAGDAVFIALCAIITDLSFSAYIGSSPRLWGT